MDEVIESPASNQRLFNSTLEVAMRALFIMDAFHPLRLDLSRLSVFDYFVLHTEDIGGPPSLHASLDQRTGEYLVRRGAIQTAIAFLRRNHLIKVINDQTGQVFEMSQEASALLDVVSTGYHEKLKIRALWLATQSEIQSEIAFDENLRQLLQAWNSDLQSRRSMVG